MLLLFSEKTIAKLTGNLYNTEIYDNTDVGTVHSKRNYSNAYICII